jgi:hypothetical protein
LGLRSYLLLPLFTRMRGREVLRSSDVAASYEL